VFPSGGSVFDQAISRYVERVKPVGVAYTQYRDDPVGFSEGVLGSQLTVGQAAILESVRDHRITVVQSANAVGKTYVAADAALWFGRCFAQSKTVVTAAPPLNNLERLLWGELSGRLRGLVAPDQVRNLFVGWDRRRSDRSQWWTAGRAIPQSASPNEREARFSGVHAPHLLFIVDEGDAVPPEIYRGIESCMSGEHDRLLILFNPRHPAGYVWNLIRDGRANLLTLTAFEHPNVITGENVIPGAVSRARTVERISQWSRPLVSGEAARADDMTLFTVPDFLDGEQAARPNGVPYPALQGGEVRKILVPELAYMVLGRYPTQLYNALIDRAWVQAARARWQLRRETFGDKPPIGIRPRTGQDVAEMGDDFNVLLDRHGSWVSEAITWAKVDIPVSTDRGIAHARRVNSEYHFVDANGIGAGVVPTMHRKGIRQAVAVKTQTKPTQKPEDLGGEFGILRDQLFWAVREWLRQDPMAMLPPDDDLEDDLLVLTYSTMGGKVKVMTKKEAKTLLQRSPDKGDALALTFAQPVIDEGLPMPARPVRAAKRPEEESERPRRRRKRRKGRVPSLSGKL